MPLPTSPGGVRVERVVTAGQFCLDDGCWDVENNVWIVGDDTSCVVIDAAHDPSAILERIDGREVKAIVLTHGHNDHINAAADLADATGAPIGLFPADDMLWQMTYPRGPGYLDAADGEELVVGDVTLTILHTPGHSPGAVCLLAPVLGVVFSGDTLFQGGPGATGRSFSDFPTIISSIESRLLTLPPETVVLTGHGDATTIGDEAPHLQEWIDRGH